MTPFLKDEDGEKPEAAEPTPKPIEQLFFKSRTVLVTGEINDKLAQRVVMQLLALAQDGDDPINMIISSPGGHVVVGGGDGNVSVLAPGTMRLLATTKLEAGVTSCVMAPGAHKGACCIS